MCSGKISVNRWSEFYFFAGKAKRMITGKRILKIVMVIIVFSFGISMDLLYHNVPSVGLLCDIRNSFMFFGHFFGLSYTAGLELLKSNFGVLITAVSLFLTMSMNLITRTEDTVFGIPRGNLNYPSVFSQSLYVRVVSKAMFVAPVFMIILINLQLCVTGYILILFCFFFVYRLFYLYRTSYNKENDIHLIAENLLDNGMKQLERSDTLAYQGFVETITSSIRQNNEWTSALKIYFELGELIYQKKLDPIAAAQIYRGYFTSVFLNPVSENTLDALKTIFFHYCGKSVQDSSRQLMMYIFPLYTFIQASDEQYLKRHLQWFLDFPNLQKHICLNDENGLLPETFYLHAGVLLIYTETWFRKGNMLKEKESVKETTRLWQKGRLHISENQIFQLFIGILSKIDNMEANKIDAIYEDLIKDSTEPGRDNYCTYIKAVQNIPL